MIEFRNLTKKRVDVKTIKKLYGKIFTNQFELSVVIAPPSLMLDLNKKYRRKNKAANTLSFLLESRPHGKSPGKGEIFLNSKEKNLPYLFVHSALHLLGFDHGRKKNAEAMERKEINILKLK